ncbi:MAG: PEP-CTERM sorting domain-containing protein [Rhodopila sp.]
MKRVLSAIAVCLALWPAASQSAAIPYSITVTTAYATADPFPDRLDDAFTEPHTGYLEIDNTGTTSFSGIVGTIAISAFAGDLSFTSDALALAPGAAVSIAMPDNSASVGGFNGAAYFQRPGVEITLNGTIADGLSNEAVSLLVADADIHSGVPRTDQYGLTSDSYVLQGGDPWGFDTGAAYGLSQTDGTYVFTSSVPEPASLTLLGIAAASLYAIDRRRRSNRVTPLPCRDRACPPPAPPHVSGSARPPTTCRRLSTEASPMKRQFSGVAQSDPPPLSPAGAATAVRPETPGRPPRGQPHRGAGW